MPLHVRGQAPANSYSWCLSVPRYSLPAGELEKVSMDFECGAYRPRDPLRTKSLNVMDLCE